MKLFDDYSIIAENEIEWFSSKRGCTHAYGLLVRVLDVGNLNELNVYFHLSDDFFFRLTFEHGLQLIS